MSSQTPRNSRDQSAPSPTNLTRANDATGEPMMPNEVGQESDYYRNADGATRAEFDGAAPATNGYARRVLLWFVKMALAIACLAWLAYSGRLDLARLRVVSLSPELLLLLVCVMASLVIPAVRWWCLLKAQGLSESLAYVLRLTWFGYFASLFLPGAAGGDAAKALLIVRRQPRDKLRALSTVLVDRYLGLYSVLVVGLAAFVWIVLSESATSSVLLIGGALLGLLLAMTAVPLLVLWAPSRYLFQRWMPRKWHPPIDAVCAEYVASKPTLWLAFGLSIVSNLCVFAGLLAAAHVLEFAASPAAVFLSGPVITLANLIPLTPGGIGVGEAASQYLMATLNSAGGAEMMMFFRLVSILLTIPAVFLIQFSRARS
ncbi:MAG: lysylphosphatidylglycerol synthase transmembrane domain-containing protein [Pirellulales bacterium]